MFKGRRGPAIPDSGTAEFLSAQARHYKPDSRARNRPISNLLDKYYSTKPEFQKLKESKLAVGA